MNQLKLSRLLLKLTFEHTKQPFLFYLADNISIEEHDEFWRRGAIQYNLDPGVVGVTEAAIDWQRDEVGPAAETVFLKQAGQRLRRTVIRAAIYDDDDDPGQCLTFWEQGFQAALREIGRAIIADDDCYRHAVTEPEPGRISQNAFPFRANVCGDGGEQAKGIDEIAPE